VRNPGAFYELSLQDDELKVTHWDVQTGDVNHDYYPVPQGNAWSAITRRQDAEGNLLLFEYNEARQLVGINQQREQRGLRLVYDKQGRLIQVYRSSRALAAEAQDDQPWLQYEYDEQGRLIQFTDPLGATSQYHYDDAQRMTNERTLAGMNYSFRFNAQGRCNYLSGDNDFDRHQLHYDNLARTTKVTNSLGHTTTYHWNEYNQVEKIISPAGQMSTTLYDDDDRIIAEITPGGSTTQYAYDEYGNRSSITAPDGAVVAYAFNAQHQVVSITDPLGNQWQREYDAKGRLTQLTNPLAIPQQFTYNPRGDLTGHQDGAGNQRRFEWDAFGNLTRATDWQGNRSQYAWDAFGNLIRYTDAAGHNTEMRRDRVGHLLQLTLPDGNQRHYAWDIYDNLKSYTDENQVSTRWSYCACGNIEQETKPDGSKIGYGWNPIPGQLAHLTNEKGELYHFEYDIDGRLIQETDFSGATTQYRYDVDGQIAEVHKPSGHISRYRHDPAGRITEVLHDDGSLIRYAYDARGLLVQADNQSCPVSFEYDALGRLIRETQGEQVIEHEYDALNNRIRRKTSNGDTTEFNWNPNGQIERVQQTGFDPVQFAYDPRGYETQRQLGASMAYEQQVDLRGRLVQQALNQQTGPAHRLVQRHYTYDAASNLLGKQDTTWGTTEYTYDILERIESTLHPDQMLERFTYDDNSNITSYQQHQVKPGTDPQAVVNTNAYWQYQRGNQLMERDGTHYEYDPDGQLIGKTDTTGETRYRWNRQGQLVAIHKPDGTEWHYRYDALSRRVEKRGPNTHIEYTWDGDVILYEKHHAETEQNSQTHQWEYHPNDFSPLYKLENRAAQYYSLNDQIGTPLELIDKTGEQVWSERLQTFGGVKATETCQIECPIRFQGQWADEESGLYYNRFRYYDAESGRYISSDPIGLLGGLRLYAYVRNPNGWVDPLGLSGKCPILSGADDLDSITVKNTNLQPDGYQLNNVKIKDGKILIDGKPANGVVDFVITEKGELKLGAGHYTISGQAASVKGAGELYLENGKIDVVNRASGHYQPTSGQLNNIKTTFENNGLLKPDYVDFGRAELPRHNLIQKN
jgi:RHS repeat-associated protein